MPPKVSVVIPVYNRAHSVLPTLRSVQEQTFADFECIVVDDGSKDGDELQAVVEGLQDDRFRYVRRENGGGGAARNTGIDEAEGEIVAFLDSDDRWLPDKLARDLEAGADRRTVFSPVFIERGGRIVGRRPTASLQPGEKVADYVACRQGFVQTSTVSLPTQLARKVRFDPLLPFGQDTDFAIRVAHAGGELHGRAGPSVIMRDDESSTRVSRSRDWAAALAWLERARPLFSRRSYLCYRGWHVARLAAHDGHRLTALHFYLAALAQGAFSPSLALKALAQVLIPRSAYRFLPR